MTSKRFLDFGSVGRGLVGPGFVCFLLILAGCSRPPRMSAFTSDGCTLFPDGDPERHENWCGCCVDHDYAYWKGGPDEERRAADSALGACIYRRTGDSALAVKVYRGTRAGGSSYFPTWYRWGYGWPYGRQGVPDSVRARELARQGRVDRVATARKVCGEVGTGEKPEPTRADTAVASKKGPAGAGP